MSTPGSCCSPTPGAVRGRPPRSSNIWPTPRPSPRGCCARASSGSPGQIRGGGVTFGDRRATRAVRGPLRHSGVPQPPRCVLRRGRPSVRWGGGWAPAGPRPGFRRQALPIRPLTRLLPSPRQDVGVTVGHEVCTGTPRPRVRNATGSPSPLAGSGVGVARRSVRAVVRPVRFPHGEAFVKMRCAGRQARPPRVPALPGIQDLTSPLRRGRRVSCSRPPPRGAALCPRPMSTSSRPPPAALSHAVSPVTRRVSRRGGSSPGAVCAPRACADGPPPTWCRTPVRGCS